MRVVYTGSFDIYHNGHKDIVDRLNNLYGDKNVYIVIGVNANKTRLIPVKDSIKIIKSIHRKNPIYSHTGLISDFCKGYDIDLICKGVRSYQDFESEVTQAKYNGEVLGNTETSIMISKASHISSSAVKTLINTANLYHLENLEKIESLIPFQMMSYLVNKTDLLKDFFCIELGGSESEFTDIKTCLSERPYHNLYHSYNIIKSVRKIHYTDIPYGNKILMFIAAFYHDIVYDPLSETNEEDSVEKLKKTSFFANSGNIIASYIITTKWNEKSEYYIENKFKNIDCEQLATEDYELFYFNQINVIDEIGKEKHKKFMNYLVNDPDSLNLLSLNKETIRNNVDKFLNEYYG